MKANFKQLGLATAVAAASAGYAGIANAQAAIAGNHLGDMAIVPYYTVNGDLVTGVHIINTSDMTQVVKIRLRRASDSMDALDFNLVMSPFDEWTGFLTNGSPTEGEDGEMVDDGQVTFNTSDKTCTVPVFLNGGTVAPMPEGIYDMGAQTGYIEVIGMGSADSTQDIAKDAKHVSGVPVSCDRVRENFAKLGVSGSKIGNVDSENTVQTTLAGTFVDNVYGDTGDVLKVSFFIRDAASGVESGSNARHIGGFLAAASMTNQISGIFSQDMQGFDFPDLNGGAPLSALMGIGATRGKYEELRSAFGTSELINDWSANTTGGITVGTDWVVTAPGQYAMLDLSVWVPSTIGSDAGTCGDPLDPLYVECDYRDIPLKASFTIYDREELGVSIDPDDLVFSPSIPGIVNPVDLDKEVNVVKWAPDSVLQADQFGGKVLDMSMLVPEGAVNGWASLVVSANDVSALRGQKVCDFSLDPNAAAVTCTDVVDPAAIPLVGFAAWQRAFDANPGSNYGRIVDHSYTVSSS
jgi:hypothetical protein